LDIIAKTEKVEQTLSNPTISVMKQHAGDDAAEEEMKSYMKQVIDWSAQRYAGIPEMLD
jgi:hypothetical protein